MWLTVLALMLGQTEPSILDNVIKARIELARQQLAQACPPGPKVPVAQPEATPKPPVAKPLPASYVIARKRALREGKPLLVLVGGSEPSNCNQYGCFPIPSRFITCKVSEFPDMGDGPIKTGVVVSVPENGDVIYKATLPDHCTIQSIDNVINPIVTVGFQPSFQLDCKT